MVNPNANMLEDKIEVSFSNTQLAKLILPLLLEQVLSISVGFADSLMVSTVGDAAISGVSLVDAIINLLFYVFTAMATGGTVVAGQYLGRQDKDRAQRICRQLVMLLLCMSCVITALMYAFRSAILTAVFGGLEADVMRATEKYYIIVIASLPAIALFNGGSALFRIMSRTDVPLKVSVMMNVVNVVGNAILILGLKMDISGVAIPTLVSRFLAAAVMTILLFNKKYELHLYDMRGFRFDGHLIKSILSISIPCGIEEGMFHLGRLVLFSMVATLSTASIVANAVGNTLANFQVFAGRAVDMALITVVSRCVGAGQFETSKYYKKKLMCVAYTVIFAINIIVFLLLPAVMKAYSLSNEAEKLTKTVVMLSGVAAILLWSSSFITAGALRAAGDARYTMLVSIGSMWVCRVFGAYIMAIHFGLGVIGVWLAQCVLDWSVRSILLVWRYRSGVWMSKAIQ